MNSVSKKKGKSILFISTAESIWKKYTLSDAPRVCEFEQQLSRIKQGSMDISTYHTALVIWEEYKNYVDLRVCTYGKCECSAAKLWNVFNREVVLPNS